jgi:hypothetical protein
MDSLSASMSAWDAERAAQFCDKWANHRLHKAVGIIEKHNARRGGKMPDEAGNTVGDLLLRADKLILRAQMYREVREHRQAIIRSEPRTYSEHSPHSWYLDRARSAVPGMPGHDAAVERLERYGRELEVEVQAGSAEGKRALAAAAVESRANDVGHYDTEIRAMSTVSSSGGSLVTPIYLLDQGEFGLYNTAPPAVLAQTHAVKDPGYGLELQLPVFGSSVSITNQTTGGEDTGIADAEPTASFTTANLQTHAGEVDVSQ